MASRSARICGAYQQEVGIHYLFILVIAVGLCAMHFSQSVCHAAPLQRETNIVGNYQTALYIPDKSLQRRERSITDYIKGLFRGTQTPSPVSSGSADKAGGNSANGDLPQNADNSSPSTGSGSSGTGGSRSSPPATSDGSDAGKQSLTGNKWVDLVIGAVVESRNKQGSGDSSTNGDSSGGSGVGSAIVTAIAGAAIKSILSGVLG